MARLKAKLKFKQNKANASAAAGLGWAGLDWAAIMMTELAEKEKAKLLYRAVLVLLLVVVVALA